MGIGHAEVSQAQRERLAFLEMRAYFTGELKRGDIEARFGVKPAAASRDLSLYRECAPRNLDYDQASRRYRPAPRFKPLFKFQEDRVKAWLLQGFGDGLELGMGQALPCEGPGQISRLDMGMLARVTRAILSHAPLRIDYMSLSSGPSQRDIVPVALADNGLRWHVRAFDRSRQRFGDFTLTRISKASPLSEKAEAHELLGSDEQWARMVVLDIAPHPGMAWPKAVESDYGMADGVLRLTCRAALAGYVLRRWSIDSTPNHRLDPSSHHLWLRNAAALEGVESASIAPGAGAAPDKSRPPMRKGRE